MRPPETFAGFTRRLIAIPQSGDRSAPHPSLPDRNARNSPARWTAGHTCRPAKVRFIRLRQRLGEILDAARPQEGEYRPRSITAAGIQGQNDHGNTQELGGWTREWVARGQKGQGRVGNQPTGMRVARSRPHPRRAVEAGPHSLARSARGEPPTGANVPGRSPAAAGHMAADWKHLLSTRARHEDRHRRRGGTPDLNGGYRVAPPWRRTAPPTDAGPGTGQRQNHGPVDEAGPRSQGWGQ